MGTVFYIVFRAAFEKKLMYVISEIIRALLFYIQSVI